MRKIAILCALLVSTGCESSSELGATGQAATGPGGATVTVRAAGELAVSWAPDPIATQYQVFQSASDELFVLVASVFDSGGGTPSTSYIATELTAGVRYCYELRAAYPDGSTSDLGAAGCETATGAGTHPPRETIPLAAAAFVAADPTHPVNYAFGVALGESLDVRASVPVPVGHQILAVRATVVDGTDPNAKLNLQLISINTHGTNVIASSQVSEGNGTQQVLSIAPATTVAPHTAYQLRVYALGVPSAQDALWFAEVDCN